MKRVVNQGAYGVTVDRIQFSPGITVVVPDELAITLCQKYDDKDGNYYFVLVEKNTCVCPEVNNTFGVVEPVADAAISAMVKDRLGTAKPAKKKVVKKARRKSK